MYDNSEVESDLEVVDSNLFKIDLALVLALF